MCIGSLAGATGLGNDQAGLIGSSLVTWVAGSSPTIWAELGPVRKIKKIKKNSKIISKKSVIFCKYFTAF